MGHRSRGVLYLAADRPLRYYGRIHVPTLMGALARKFSWRRPKLLFDIRGFMPEEYTDAGIWSENGLLYRGAKRIERWLMKEADGFVVLTDRARDILFGEEETGRREGEGETGDKEKRRRGDSGTKGIRDPHSAFDESKIQNPKFVEVIPCCVDLENRFAGDRVEMRKEYREKLGIAERHVVVHLGALGGLYLCSEIADLLTAARERDPTTFALF